MAYDRRDAPRKTCSKSCAGRLKAAALRLKAEEAWRALGLDPEIMRATASVRHRMSAKASRRRRRLRHAETWDGITDEEILERDGWRCGICRKRIGKKYEYPHPRSKSVDHIVPIAHGGDDVEANKQAAHLSCNLLKNDNISSGVQLRLPVLQPRRETEIAGTAPRPRRRGDHTCACGRQMEKRTKADWRCYSCRPLFRDGLGKQERAERARRAAELRRGGDSWNNIAEELGYSSGSVCYAAARNRILADDPSGEMWGKMAKAYAGQSIGPRPHGWKRELAS